MREWRVMLGPFLIWAAHFLIVYTIASLADLADTPTAQGLRTAGFIATALCGLGLAAQFVRSRGLTDLSPLAHRLAGIGFAASLIAVAWQSLPLALSS